MARDDETEIRRCILVRETAKALQITTPKGQTVWIPISLVSYLKRHAAFAGTQEVDVTLPDWFLDKENIDT